MKNFPISSIATIALAALFLVAPVRAQNANDPVRVEAQTKTSQERKDIKGASVDEVTQIVSLLISLRGKPRASDSRVVTWTFFGRDLEGKFVSKIDSGTAPLALTATGDQKIETPSISATSTPAHVLVNGNGGNNGQNVRTKKVPASGVKYIGYSVVVTDGGKIVGEVYSQPSFKDGPK